MSRRQVDYAWHLRQVMASRGLFATTDLAPLLAERGIELSATQVYRLVVQRPERLSLHTLSALCDALGCSPSELVEPHVVTGSATRRKTGGSRAAGPADPGTGPDRPRRARIVEDP